LLEMKRRLLWKLFFTFATGGVALFYLIDYLAKQTENAMSHLAHEHKTQLKAWGVEAEAIYKTQDQKAINAWLEALQAREQITAAIVSFSSELIAGNKLNKELYTAYNLGRSIDWPIHLYLNYNPLMQIPFKDGKASFIVILPDRMRPGNFWQSAKIGLQIIVPMLLLAMASWLVYRHIMRPLKQLQKATDAFSNGDYSVRIKQLLGNRNDEISDLAATFDTMATRIGEHIINQRQLISDLSHELRTPLTRLDMAVDGLLKTENPQQNIPRIQRESKQIRKLVEDTLTLAWMENENFQLTRENLDLIDLIDVLLEDACFEFPNKGIASQLPNTAPVYNTNHLALGQALENILRNALFRVDKSRSSNTSGNHFGLGLALTKRQLSAIGAKVCAFNLPDKGLCVQVDLPLNATHS